MKCICSFCHGRGSDVEITCRNCSGTGYDPEEDNVWAQCHTCYGDGFEELDECPKCNGEGYTDDDDDDDDDDDGFY
ncbi:molecular chaperone DnaJ [uncultured Aliivibrio sp.]|uniref:molecular chaperone DnaJ n=1 Tax=uncultured Aliivibrio sp. TaxID=873085 RepID=UPI00260C810C|nr:molecular chaperone DnaJ [uncultured Aliivibrio sp.]